MNDFIVTALFGGLGIALMTGVIGCFVVWRQMAYYGEALAHSSILGIALGILAGITESLGIFVVSILIAGLLLWLSKRQNLTADTLIGVLAHVALSFGIVALTFQERNVNLHSYLIGDILTINTVELAWIYGLAPVLLGLIYWRWDALLLATLDENMARTENTSRFPDDILLMLCVTTLITMCIRIVGVLFLIALLVIPQASARQLTRSPEAMAFCSIGIGSLGVTGGIYGSVIMNWPTGPGVVFVVGMLFFVSLIISRFRK